MTCCETTRVKDMKHFKKNSRGFTMIEIIAVLLVISIIGAAAMISGVYSTSDYDLTSQTDILESQLRYAQARAMNSDVVWGIEFSSTTTYSLFKYDADSGKVFVDLPGENSSTVVFQDDNGTPTGMTVTGGIIVSFDSWGRPYTGEPAAQTLQSEDDGWRTITLSYKGDTESIRVTNNTGFIYIP